MRSLNVSVPHTARTTPNTARSARSGWLPPMKGRPCRASTHSSADCGTGGQGGGWEGGRRAGSAQLDAQLDGLLLPNEASVREGVREENRAGQPARLPASVHQPAEARPLLSWRLAHRRVQRGGALTWYSTSLTSPSTPYFFFSLPLMPHIMVAPTSRAAGAAREVGQSREAGRHERGSCRQQRVAARLQHKHPQPAGGAASRGAAAGWLRRRRPPAPACHSAWPGQRKEPLQPTQGMHGKPLRRSASAAGPEHGAPPLTRLARHPAKVALLRDVVKSLEGLVHVAVDVAGDDLRQAGRGHRMEKQWPRRQALCMHAYTQHRRWRPLEGGQRGVACGAATCRSAVRRAKGSDGTAVPLKHCSCDRCRSAQERQTGLPARRWGASHAALAGCQQLSPPLPSHGSCERPQPAHQHCPAHLDKPIVHPPPPLLLLCYALPRLRAPAAGPCRALAAAAAAAKEAAQEASLLAAAAASRCAAAAAAALPPRRLGFCCQPRDDGAAVVHLLAIHKHYRDLRPTEGDQGGGGGGFPALPIAPAVLAHPCKQCRADMTVAAKVPARQAPQTLSQPAGATARRATDLSKGAPFCTRST